MVNYILKDCPDVDTSYITIHQLERTLHGRWSRLSINLSEDQIKNAKQNWDDLEKQLKPLPYNLYKIIGHFKADRNIYAHAKFDTQTVLHKNSLDQKVKMIFHSCLEFFVIFQVHSWTNACAVDTFVLVFCVVFFLYCYMCKVYDVRNIIILWSDKTRLWPISKQREMMVVMDWRNFCYVVICLCMCACFSIIYIRDHVRDFSVLNMRQQENEYSCWFVGSTDWSHDKWRPTWGTKPLTNANSL